MDRSIGLHTLADAVRSLRLTTYCVEAAFGLLLYDWMLTLDQEIEFIWRHSPLRTKVLFLTCRWLGALILGFFALGPTLPIHYGDNFCWGWYHTWLWGAYINAMVVQLILIIRVWAVYNRSRRIILFLGPMWAAQIITQAVILGVAVPKSHLLPLPNLPCVFQPSKLLTFFWIPQCIFEGILVFLVLWKGVQSWNLTRITRTHGPAGLLSILVRDSIVIFTAMFSTYVINAMLDVFGPPASNGAAIGFTISLTSALGCRLMLNLRSARLGELDSSATKAHRLEISSDRDTRDTRTPIQYELVPFKPSLDVVHIASPPPSQRWTFE